MLFLELEQVLLRCGGAERVQLEEVAVFDVFVEDLFVEVLLVLACDLRAELVDEAREAVLVDVQRFEVLAESLVDVGDAELDLVLLAAVQTLQRRPVVLLELVDDFFGPELAEPLEEEQSDVVGDAQLGVFVLADLHDADEELELDFGGVFEREGRVYLESVFEVRPDVLCFFEADLHEVLEALFYGFGQFVGAFAVVLLGEDSLEPLEEER